MATFVKVRNVNPLGDVTVALPDGRREVEAGEVITVPPEVAGEAPRWRKPRDGDDLAFMEVRRGDDGQVKEVHDLGTGLLAQIGNWEPADGPQDKPKDASRESGKETSKDDTKGDV